MSAHDTQTRKGSKQRWAIPGVALVIGLLYFAAGWIGGDHSFGVFGLVLMVCAAVVIAVGSRYSETVAGLVDRRDERINAIDGTAIGVTGGVLILAIIGAFIVNVARGGDGSPYAGLGAIGGVTYVVALIVLRYRR